MVYDPAYGGDIPEEDYPFNDEAYSAADCEHWSKAALWTLDQAITLSFNRDPHVIGWANVSGCPPEIEFVRRYTDLRRLVLRAHEVGDLSDPVAPKTFIAWMRLKDLPFPSTLAQMVHASSAGRQSSGGHKMEAVRRACFDLWKGDGPIGLSQEERLTRVNAVLAERGQAKVGLTTLKTALRDLYGAQASAKND